MFYFSAMASSLLASIMDFLDSGIDEFYTQDNEEYENEEDKHINENNEDSENNQGEVEGRESEDTKSRSKKYSRSDSQMLKGSYEKSAEDSSGDKTDDDVYSKDRVSKLR